MKTEYDSPSKIIKINYKNSNESHQNQNMYLSKVLNVNIIKNDVSSIDTFIDELYKNITINSDEKEYKKDQGCQPSPVRTKKLLES